MKFTYVSAIALFAITVSCTTSKQPDVEVQAAQESTISQPQLAQAQMELEAPEREIFYITANSGLSLRKASNLRSKKLLTIPYGSQVTLLSKPAHTSLTVDGKSGTMIEVDYQGARGFIFDGYASKLAPPHDDESITAYANRITTVVEGVKVTQEVHPKGKAFGMTTTLHLPAKTWDEAYTLSRKLFHLPKNIAMSKIETASDQAIVNSKKIKASLKDELTVTKNTEGEITALTYNYLLRDYSRSVTITEDQNGFIIKEIEAAE